MGVFVGIAVTHTVGTTLMLAGNASAGVVTPVLFNTSWLVLARQLTKSDPFASAGSRGIHAPSPSLLHHP